MPKPETTLASTEVMHPGQTSDALRVKLKQVGSRLSDAQITDAWRATEKARVSFTCAATYLGVILLAKKESLGHGKWLPWCEKFGGKLAQETKGQIGTTVPISTDVTGRSLRKYTFVGQHFLADLEQGAFAGEIVDHKPKLEGVSADDVLALDTLKADRRKAVLARIEQFVAGRSLRTMLLDFRRAENAADQEELEAQAEAARRKRKKDGDGGTAAGQLDFFTELKTPLTTIGTYLDSERVVKHADKGFWEAAAAALEQQAEICRRRAKEMSS